jgi:hypothetical protein
MVSGRITARTLIAVGRRKSARSAPSIFSAIFVCELPLAVRPKHGFDIVGRAASFITRRSVADFEISDIAIGPIDQVMCEALCWEPCTLAWRKCDFTLVRHQRTFSLPFPLQQTRPRQNNVGGAVGCSPTSQHVVEPLVALDIRPASNVN